MTLTVAVAGECGDVEKIIITGFALAGMSICQILCACAFSTVDPITSYKNPQNHITACDIDYITRCNIYSLKFEIVFGFLLLMFHV